MKSHVKCVIVLTLLLTGALAAQAHADPVDLKVNPNELFFGRVTIGQTSKPKEVRIENPPHRADASILRIAVSGDFAESDDCPKKLEGGAKCTVTVTFKPRHTGPLSGFLIAVGGIEQVPAPHLILLNGVGIVAATPVPTKVRTHTPTPMPTATATPPPSATASATPTPGCEGAPDGTKCADSGVCTGGKCVPATCFDTVKDGDETDVDCGGSCPACPAGKGCGLNADCSSGLCDPTSHTCVVCTPKTCAQSGAQCGTIADGCGAFEFCGSCTAPDTCGGGGIPNVCGAMGCTSNADCPGGQVCSGGMCVAGCPGGQMLCDAQCVNPSNDPNNCGACGVQCGPTQTCFAGACEAKRGAGAACTSDSQCLSGVCQSGVCTAPAS